MRTILLFLFCLSFSLTHAQSTNVTLNPDQDATLYENSFGDIANGSGEHLFLGRTNGGNVRRALIRFDLGNEIPASATIDSVFLVLSVTRAQGGDYPVQAFAVTSDWGEGASDASGQEGRGTNSTNGDATWVHSFYPNTNWNSNGGDFGSTVLFDGTLTNNGTYTIKAESAFNALLSDWISGTTENFGIILLGDENTNASSKRIGSLQNAGTAQRPSLQVYFSEVATNNEFDTDVPDQLTLNQNYPNPFNPETTISFSLPESGNVELSVFNMLGQQVATLTNQTYAAGSHSLRFNASGLSSGIYIYRITTAQGTQARRLTILK